MRTAINKERLFLINTISYSRLDLLLVSNVDYCCLLLVGVCGHLLAILRSGLAENTGVENAGEHIMESEF